MELKEVPTPQINNPKDVLVKMKVVGVCGSDVHYYLTGKIGSQVVQYPFPVGHEGAGIVEKIGDGVTKVKPGDRIAVEPAMPCGECDQCKAGRPHTCRNLKFLGCPKQADGCLSEYIVIPEDSCVPIKDEMTFDQAAISEPLAIGVYAVQQSIDMKGKKVGVLGFGPIGITEEEPLLLDVVFECCGDQDAVFQAIDILKPGGKLMIIGIPPTLDNWQFPVDKLRHKEICIQNVRRQNHCVQKALDMIDNKEINVDVMATHRFKFEDTKDAWGGAQRRGVFLNPLLRSLNPRMPGGVARSDGVCFTDNKI